jgi:hypothetical protein
MGSFIILPLLHWSKAFLGFDMIFAGSLLLRLAVVAPYYDRFIWHSRMTHVFLVLPI